MCWYKSFREKVTGNFYFFTFFSSYFFRKFKKKTTKNDLFLSSLVHIVLLRKYLYLMHKWHFAKWFSRSTLWKMCKMFKKMSFTNSHFLLFLKLHEANFPLRSPKSNFFFKKEKPRMSLTFGLLRRTFFERPLP